MVFPVRVIEGHVLILKQENTPTPMLIVYWVQQWWSKQYRNCIFMVPLCWDPIVAYYCGCNESSLGDIYLHPEIHRVSTCNNWRGIMFLATEGVGKDYSKLNRGLTSWGASWFTAKLIIDGSRKYTSISNWSNSWIDLSAIRYVIRVIRLWKGIL